jgi:hypothetical protein
MWDLPGRKIGGGGVKEELYLNINVLQLTIV